MKVVIIVTIVFFVLTLAGTWLARRSAYSWADNERPMGDGPAPAGDARIVPAPEKAPTPRTAGGARTPTSARAQQPIVVRGFDDPKAD